MENKINTNTKSVGQVSHTHAFYDFVPANFKKLAFKFREGDIRQTFTLAKIKRILLYLVFLV